MSDNREELKAEYDARRKSNNEKKLAITIEFQNQLKATPELFNLPKGFEIKLSDLNSKAAKQNHSLGFFSLAFIYYKEQSVGNIKPNFADSYTEVKLDKKPIYMEVKGFFYDFIEKIVYIKECTGNGWSDEENKVFNKKFYKGSKDFETVQNCIDDLEERRALIHKEMNNFFDSDVDYEKYDPNAYVKCEDKFDQ